MFCSEECRNIATKSFAPIKDQQKINLLQRILLESLSICGGSFSKLQQLIHDVELSNKTVFDFDFNNTEDLSYNYHMLLAIISLKKSKTVHLQYLDAINQHPVLQFIKTQEERNIARKCLVHFARIVALNAFHIADGKGVFAFSSLLNHSCIPNVSWRLVDTKMVLVVMSSIPKDQQLFVTYGWVEVGIGRIFFISNYFQTNVRWISAGIATTAVKPLVWIFLHLHCLPWKLSCIPYIVGFFKCETHRAKFQGFNARVQRKLPKNRW